MASKKCNYFLYLKLIRLMAEQLNIQIKYFFFFIIIQIILVRFFFLIIFNGILIKLQFFNNFKLLIIF